MVTVTDAPPSVRAARSALRLKASRDALQTKCGCAFFLATFEATKKTTNQITTIPALKAAHA
jgi:hypothetical protein